MERLLYGDDYLWKLCLIIDQNSVEEVIASTAYLELFLRKVTHPGLLKTFLHFILLGRVDDVSVAESLASRITNMPRVSMSNY